MKLPNIYQAPLFIACFIVLVGVGLWVTGLIGMWNSADHSRDYMPDISSLVPYILICFGFSLAAYVIKRAFDRGDVKLSIEDKE